MISRSRDAQPTGGAALLIAGLTVSFQAVRSARANPVKSLRYN
jgi:hypothetical protein